MIHDRPALSGRGSISRYVAHAAGEIAFIFVGITLALWFGNWNAERQLRTVELQTLADIAEDLRANATHIGSNIDTDSKSIDACIRFTRALDSEASWSEALGTDLGFCHVWTSPFLRSAGYESLKMKGPELVVNPGLRSEIIALYEQSYRFLLDDIDKAFWAFHSAVIDPVFNRYARADGADYVPNDFKQLRNAPEFRNMLARKLALQDASIQTQRSVLKDTNRVIRSIDAELTARKEP